MIKILFDINIILDCFNQKRRSKFPQSIQVFDYINNNKNIAAFISTSSLDNIEFLKHQDLKESYSSLSFRERKIIIGSFIQDLMVTFKLAKTPAYIQVDYDNIENSQVIASAIAVDAQVVTRDLGMLEKYPQIAITAEKFLQQIKTEQPGIDFANLKKQYCDIQPQIEQQMDDVLNATSFIMGDKIKQLESELQIFTQAKYAITCSSGTDALLLAMMAMDIQPGDEIITTPFTFIATAETIALMKAVPVFVDIEEDTLNIDATKIEAAITNKTTAIMPVSLYGQPADMDEINEIAKKHNLKVIIDGAQSFGATYKNQMEVHHCDIFTTSFFPAKPLGCYGDGGAVFTNNDEYAEKIKMMRVHGQNKRYHHKYIGMGGRLDTIQAAVLLAKLSTYAKEVKMRQGVASTYTTLLQSINSKSDIKCLKLKNNRTSVWAQYTIKTNKRDELQEKLKQQNIPSAVHYPMPLHKQECFQYLNKGISFPISEKVAHEVMSIPMNPYVTDTEQEVIINVLSK